MLLDSQDRAAVAHAAEAGATYPTPLGSSEYATDPVIESEILLAVGRFREAVERLHGLERVDDYSRYLIAVAYETQGLHASALAQYEHLVQEAELDLTRRAVAQLGGIRCRLAMGERAALGQLAEWMLQSGPLPREVVAEGAYVFVQHYYVDRYSRDSRPSLWSSALLWPEPRPVAERYAEWLVRLYLLRPQSVSAVGPVWRWEGVGSGGLESLLVSGEWPPRRVWEHVGQLCSHIGWQWSVDRDSADLLESVVAVKVSRLPVMVILAALLAKAGVEWQIGGYTLQIGKSKVMPLQLITDAAYDLAPDHPWAVALALILANERVSREDGEYSRQIYRHIFEYGDQLSYQLIAVYNAAMLEYRDRRYAAARARWYDLIDLVPASPWAACGSWWLGRVALDAGDLPTAERHWRGLLRQRDTNVIAAARLGLCLIHSLRDEWRLVERLLSEQRFPIDEPYASFAELYHAWVMYRHRSGSTHRQDLETALERVSYGQGFGPAGIYWGGQLCKALGNHDVWLRLFREEVDGRPHGWRDAMLLELGEYYQRCGVAVQAREYYLAVAVARQDDLGWKAQWHLAELAFEREDLMETIERCEYVLARQVAGGDANSLREGVLRLLGRAYERAGDYRRAALCFAGNYPVGEESDE